MSSPERADFMRQNIAHRRRGWLPVHRDGSLADGEEETDHEGYSHSRCFSRRGREEEFSVTRHFLQVGMRWPSPPKRAVGGYHRCCLSLGRIRDNSRGRRRVADRSRGDNGGYSWSPPRTKTGRASCRATSTVSSARGGGSSNTNSSSIPFNPESREEEEERTRSPFSGGVESPHHHHRHRSLSPLMLPLDPFRGSRMVVRAGTVAARRDVVAAERSSRRAALAARRASEARPTAKRHAADETASGISSPGRGHRGKQQQRQGRRQGRQTYGGNSGRNLDGDRDDTWTTSDVLLDEEKDERWGHTLRRFLPSVASIDRELEAIRKADAAMREEQLAQVGVRRE